MCITAQRIVTRDYIYMHPNRSKTYISLAKALPAQGTVHASPVVSDTTSFPLHSSNQSHIFQPLTHSFIQIRPFRVLYSFLSCLLASLSPYHILSYSIWLFSVAVNAHQPQCQYTSSLTNHRFLSLFNPPTQVTPIYSHPSMTSKETKDDRTAASPNSTFLIQDQDMISPIHFFQPAVTRLKNNPDALTCRLDEGVLSLSTKEKQKRKMLAGTSRGPQWLLIRFKENVGESKTGLAIQMAQ